MLFSILINALLGIRTTLALSTARFANHLWVLLDNKKVVRSLSENINIKSSVKVYDEIIRANQIWKARERLPHTRVGEIKVCWIPGHSGIEGNELADLEAKKGAALCIQEDQNKYSLASLEKWHFKLRL